MNVLNPSKVNDVNQLQNYFKEKSININYLQASALLTLAMGDGIRKYGYEDGKLFSYQQDKDEWLELNDPSPMVDDAAFHVNNYYAIPYTKPEIRRFHDFINSNFENPLFKFNSEINLVQENLEDTRKVTAKIRELLCKIEDKKDYEIADWKVEALTANGSNLYDTVKDSESERMLLPSLLESAKVNAAEYETQKKELEYIESITSIVSPKQIAYTKFLNVLLPKFWDSVPTENVGSLLLKTIEKITSHSFDEEAVIYGVSEEELADDLSTLLNAKDYFEGQYSSIRPTGEQILKGLEDGWEYGSVFKGYTQSLHSFDSPLGDIHTVERIDIMNVFDSDMDAAQQYKKDGDSIIEEYEFDKKSSEYKAFDLEGIAIADIPENRSRLENIGIGITGMILEQKEISQLDKNLSEAIWEEHFQFNDMEDILSWNDKDTELGEIAAKVTVGDCEFEIVYSGEDDDGKKYLDVIPYVPVSEKDAENIKDYNGVMVPYSSVRSFYCSVPFSEIVTTNPQLLRKQFADAIRKSILTEKQYELIEHCCNRENKTWQQLAEEKNTVIDASIAGANDVFDFIKQEGIRDGYDLPENALTEVSEEISDYYDWNNSRQNEEGLFVKTDDITKEKYLVIKNFTTGEEKKADASVLFEEHFQRNLIDDLKHSFINPVRNETEKDVFYINFNKDIVSLNTDDRDGRNFFKHALIKLEYDKDGKLIDKSIQARFENSRTSVVRDNFESHITDEQARAAFASAYFDHAVTDYLTSEYPYYFNHKMVKERENLDWDEDKIREADRFDVNKYFEMNGEEISIKVAEEIIEYYSDQKHFPLYVTEGGNLITADGLYPEGITPENAMDNGIDEEIKPEIISTQSLMNRHISRVFAKSLNNPHFEIDKENVQKVWCHFDPDTLGIKLSDLSDSDDAEFRLVLTLKDGKIADKEIQLINGKEYGDTLHDAQMNLNGNYYNVFWSDSFDDAVADAFCSFEGDIDFAEYFTAERQDVPEEVKDFRKKTEDFFTPGKGIIDVTKSHVTFSLTATDETDGVHIPTRDVSYEINPEYIGLKKDNDHTYYLSATIQDKKIIEWSLYRNDSHGFIDDCQSKLLRDKFYDWSWSTEFEKGVNEFFRTYHSEYFIDIPDFRYSVLFDNEWNTERTTSDENTLYEKPFLPSLPIEERIKIAKEFTGLPLEELSEFIQDMPEKITNLMLFKRVYEDGSVPADEFELEIHTEEDTENIAFKVKGFSNEELTNKFPYVNLLEKEVSIEDLRKQIKESIGDIIFTPYEGNVIKGGSLYAKLDKNSELSKKLMYKMDSSEKDYIQLSWDFWKNPKTGTVGNTFTYIQINPDDVNQGDVQYFTEDTLDSETRKELYTIFTSKAERFYINQFNVGPSKGMLLEPRISVALKNSNGAELLSGYMNAQRQDEREPLITPKIASIILHYLEYNDYLIYVDANGELSIADISEDFTGEGQGCCTNKDIIDEVLDSVNAAADYGYDVYNEETANIIRDLFKYYDAHEPLFIRSWGDLQRFFDFDKDRELSHYSAQELNPKDPNSPDVKKAVINHVLQSKVSSSYGFDVKKTELGELCDSYSDLIVYKYNSDFELNSFFEKDFFKAISLKVAEKEKHDISYAVTEDDINTCRPLGFDYSNSENLVTLYQLKTIFVNTLKSGQSTTELENAIFHCTEKGRNSEFGKLLASDSDNSIRVVFTNTFLDHVKNETGLSEKQIEIHNKDIIKNATKQYGGSYNFDIGGRKVYIENVYFFKSEKGEFFAKTGTKPFETETTGEFVKDENGKIISDKDLHNLKIKLAKNQIKYTMTLDEIINDSLNMDNVKLAGEKFIGELNKNLSFYKNNPWLTMKIVIDDLKKNNPDEHKLLLEYFKRENLNCKSAYDSFFEKNLGVKKSPEIKKDISNKPEKKQPDKSEPSFER